MGSQGTLLSIILLVLSTNLADEALRFPISSTLMISLAMLVKANTTGVYQAWMFMSATMIPMTHNCLNRCFLGVSSCVVSAYL